MGTETIAPLVAIRKWNTRIKLNNPLMGTET